MTPALSDCEAIRDGILAQPANSLSSVAYLAVGAWVFRRALAMEPGACWPGIAFGLAAAANGVGSLWYHGRPGDAGHWLHDVSIVLLLLVVACFDWTLVSARSRQVLVAFGLVPLVAAQVEWTWPGATNGLDAALLLVVIGAEVAVARAANRADEPAVPPGNRTAKVVLGVALVAAAVANVLGRTGSPTCAPDTLLQFHAGWHLLGAIAAGAYAVAVMEPRARLLHPSSATRPFSTQ